MLLATACSPPPVRLGGPERVESYDDALERWTRAEKDYVDFEARILAEGTFLSRDFRAAQRAHRIDTERLTRPDQEALRARDAAELAEAHTFFVAVHTHEWRWNNLQHRPPKGLWRVRLVRDDGESLAPTSIERFGTEEPTFTPLFPYYRDYYIGYRVRFPRVGPDGGDFLAGARSFILRISGPQGAVDLVWSVEGP